MYENFKKVYYIIKIYDIINASHLPVGVQLRNGIADRRDLH